MPFTPILAHGALGVFDELLFLAVSVIFLVMMGVSWVRSRNLPPEEDDDIEIIDPTNPDAHAADAPEHFNLK
jgi:hypothetical protein